MKVSVYITSFNQKDYLQKALESVLAQTFQPHEIIIIDDCSSDGSQEMIEAYKSNYPDLIIPIYNQKNMGIAQVRITALKKITGDYVTYVDGDDLYLPRKLEIEAGLILENKYDIAFSNNMYFKGDEGNIEYIWAYNKSDLPQKGLMYFETISRSFPRNSLFRMEMVNYKAWEKIGFHDTNLKIYEDYDMRIRLAKNFKINYTLEPLTKVRLGEYGLSKSSSEVHLKALRYIFKKYEKEIEGFSSEQSKQIRNIFDQMISQNENGKKTDAINLRQKLFNFFKK